MVRAAGPLDAATAREVAIRDGNAAVVAGEVRRVGGRFLLSARLFASTTGSDCPLASMCA